MSSNKHAFSIIFSIFSPRNHNYNILGKYEHAVIHTECKKSEEVRKQEIRRDLYEPLLTFLDENELPSILRHHINNKLIIAIYKSLEEGNHSIIKITKKINSAHSLPKFATSSFKMLKLQSNPQLFLKAWQLILTRTRS